MLKMLSLAFWSIFLVNQWNDLCLNISICNMENIISSTKNMMCILLNIIGFRHLIYNIIVQIMQRTCFIVQYDLKICFLSYISGNWFVIYEHSFDWSVTGHCHVVLVPMSTIFELLAYFSSIKGWLHNILDDVIWKFLRKNSQTHKYGCHLKL